MTVVKTSLRNFFAHKGRMILSGLAVVLSVAFVCGTLVFTDTMNKTFDKLFADTSANVTISAEDEGGAGMQSGTGVPPTLPASVVELVEQVDGAEQAFGLTMSMSVTAVNADNESINTSAGAPTIASNWTELDRRTMTVTEGSLPQGPTEVMVDADTAEKNDLALGDELRTMAAPGDFTAKISGIAKFDVTNPGAAILYFDTATAQKNLLGGPDRFTQVAVLSADGVTDERLREDVRAALASEAGSGEAGEYLVRTKEEVVADNKTDMGGFLDVMKYALLGFAGIALLVGIFLIVNTFSMLVAQRTREIGLMRAVGASRRQVNRSVLLEALLLGVFGSILGVAAGVGIAVGLIALMNTVGMNLSSEDLTIVWTTPVTGLVLGVVVTLVSAYLPARRASKVSPMAALRDTGVPSDTGAGRTRGVLGGVLTAAGAAALWMAAQAEEAGPGSGFLALGIFLTLLGFVLVGPFLASVVVRALSVVVLRMWGPIGRLAERNALRNPRRTGATGAALMIGLALVASLSVVGASLVASATDELDRTVGADFIVQSSGEGGFGPLTPKAAEAMKSSPHLEHVSEYRWMQDLEVTLPEGETVSYEAAAASPTYAQDVRTPTVEGELKDAYADGAMSVDEEFAAKHGLSVGDQVQVAYKGGDPATLDIAAISSNESSVDSGLGLTSVETALTFVPEDQMPLNMAMFAQAVEGEEEEAYAALKSQLEPYPQFTVQDQADFKKTLEDQVGQLLNMVYGLLALAIIVAILGVVNTLALSVVERTREIGLMRAIGLSRRQLRRMIRLESVVIALFGALLGLGLGMVWGATAQQLLALEGLKVLEIPWATIITVFFGAAVVGLVAALIPAFRAGRMNVLGAIATE